MKYLHHLRLPIPCSWLAVAIKSRKKNTRQLKRASKRAVEKRYQDFDNIIADYKVHPGATRFKRVGNLLVDFYSNAPKGLGLILGGRRRDHGLDECPYCGSPGAPDTLDHFMPKDDWPEFAIFSNNLVPQCRECAPIKGSRYYCALNGRAMFLHPMYSDTLSKLRFQFEISMQNGEPVFTPKFSVDQNSSAEDIDRLKVHVSELKLSSRMVQYCVRQYTHWKRKLEEKNFDVRNSFVVRIGESEKQDFYSDWGSAFFQGMLDNDDALNVLQKCGSKAPQLKKKVFVDLGL